MPKPAPRPNGLNPLVPPTPVDPLMLQRRGMEMLAAANRLAVEWMRATAAQHASITRRALDDMTATARDFVAAEAAPAQAEAMLALMTRAGESGLQTAQELAAMTARMHADATAMLQRIADPDQNRA